MKKILLVLSLLVFILTNCKKEEAVEKVTKVQKIKVGTEAEYKPMEYYDKEGKLVGFDIDLMNSIAKKANIEIEWVNMSFDGLIMALKTEKIDAIISSMIASPERKKQIDFTQGYEMDESDDGNSIFVVLKDSTINTIEDFKDKTFAVEAGTFQYDYVNENFKNSKIQVMSGITNIYTALEQGKADVIMIGGRNGLSLYAKEKNYPSDKYKILNENVENPKMAIGVRKDSKGLLEKLDKALSETKENGEYMELQKKWKEKIKK